MLTTWLYASICTLDRGDAPDAVRAIVEISRPRNASLGVTGALIWTGDRFAQFLEGPHAAIDALRDSIARDPRHQTVQTLEASQAPARTFDGWSLAYSGTASFVEREVKRISDQAATGARASARELKLLLIEFDQTR